MFTSLQVDILEGISSSAWVGIIAGALCGLFAGALIRALGTRSLGGLLTGAVYGLVPGAVSSAIVGTAIAAAETPLLEVGVKGMYEVPDSYLLPNLLALLLAAGIAVALAVPTSRKAPSSRCRFLLALLFWTTSGAVVGAIANVGSGFSGYFVLQSNEQPIRYAISGLAFGSCVALSWRIVVELLIWNDCGHCLFAEQVGQSHAGRTGWIKAFGMLLVAAIAVFITVWFTMYVLLTCLSSLCQGL
jgi:hypothetical protein